MEVLAQIFSLTFLITFIRSFVPLLLTGMGGLFANAPAWSTSPWTA